jgi:hypothetical protein
MAQSTVPICEMGLAISDLEEEISLSWSARRRAILLQSWLGLGVGVQCEVGWLMAIRRQTYCLIDLKRRIGVARDPDRGWQI